MIPFFPSIFQPSPALARFFSVGLARLKHCNADIFSQKKSPGEILIFTGEIVSRFLAFEVI